MRVYLAVSPGDLKDAADFPVGLAHAAYRIGEGSSLLSRNLLQSQSARSFRSELLILSDRSAPPIQQPESLAGAILRECSRRGYDGVVLDFEESSTEDRRGLAAVLGRQCAANRKALYLPEAYAAAAKQRIVIINTAVSGGNFEEHLRESCERYGSQYVALDIQRLQMSFTLPARKGQGQPLTREILDSLLREKQPTVFFSRDLCVRYFTVSQDGSTQFVLFDDAGTLRQKLKLGQKSGAAAVFFQWPEVCDIASSLLQRL